MMYLTNSERNTYKRCVRKWYYNYELGKVPAQSAEALFFGSAIGLGLDAVWENKEFIKPFADYLKTKGWKEPEKQDDLVAAYHRGVAMLTVYKERYYEQDLKDWELVAIEHPVEYVIGNIILRGMIDKVLRNKKTGKLVVLDHKTTKEDIKDIHSPYWNIKPLDPQLLGYALALEAETGEEVEVWYDAVKKHGSTGPKMKAKLRQKKDESDDDWQLRKADNTETMEEYAARILQDYRDAPEEYFRRKEIYIPTERKAQFHEEFIADANAIALTRGQQVYPQNHGNCGKFTYTCEYFKICTKTDCGGDIEQSDDFVTKENRHPELDGDETKGKDNVII